MAVALFSLREDYWTTFDVQDEDIEFLYNYLLEKETPLTTQELTVALVEERIRREKVALERQRSSKGALYIPKEHYSVNQKLVFSTLSWKQGKVMKVRAGKNPELGQFEVIHVKFEDGETKDFAAGLENHILNQPPDLSQLDETLDPKVVLKEHDEYLIDEVVKGLENNHDFIRIAGRWFPRTLLVDVNAGHLNLAEAVLDMAGGGPLSTTQLLEQVGLSTNVNARLVEFSLDLALQEDSRFDEVGPAGEVLWFLQRLEPEEVRETPVQLRYTEMEYDRNLLTPDMLRLERELDDELSPITSKQTLDEVDVHLVYPHWRCGTLPLSARMKHLFPTAYEAPRIQFTLIDGDTGAKIPAWVVRPKKYVFGLKEWYTSRGVIPGSVIRVRRGAKAGEVIVHCEKRRPSREWMRTLLVGSDGGMVFAMLKQVISTGYDERMANAIPDVEAADLGWQKIHKERQPFERIVVNTVRELAKLNPQSHVHASELYAAINIMRRCPPGPILALLASRSWFVHVGDLHFRFDDSERE